MQVTCMCMGSHSQNTHSLNYAGMCTNGNLCRYGLGHHHHHHQYPVIVMVGFDFSQTNERFTVGPRTKSSGKALRRQPFPSNESQVCTPNKKGNLHTLTHVQSAASDHLARSTHADRHSSDMPCIFLLPPMNQQVIFPQHIPIPQRELLQQQQSPQKEKPTCFVHKPIIIKHVIQKVILKTGVSSTLTFTDTTDTIKLIASSEDNMETFSCKKEEDEITREERGVCVLSTVPKSSLRLAHEKGPDGERGSKKNIKGSVWRISSLERGKRKQYKKKRKRRK